LEKETIEASNREGFLKYLQSFSTYLEGHHLIENEKIFPYFKDKLPEVPYKKLMAEHTEIKAALQKINNGITVLKSEKDELRSLKLFKSCLSQIDIIWQPHIQIEELQLYEQIGSLKINSNEMNRLINEAKEFFQEHFGPEYLIAPFILYNLSPEDRKLQAKRFPEIVTKKLIPIDWKDKWTPMKPFLIK
jgi:hemerythrin-like domain-containing protein